MMTFYLIDSRTIDGGASEFGVGLSGGSRWLVVR